MNSSDINSFIRFVDFGSNKFALVLWVVLLATFMPGHGASIPVSDENVAKGLSPYNWVRKSNYVCSSICGASLHLSFTGTRNVSLNVDTSNLVTKEASRFPIIAWSVNHGAVQTHQIARDETSIVLAAETDNPEIDLSIRGMSPFEDRYTGNAPPNALKITGLTVDDGGAAASVQLPAKIWLNIGDSIMSGDAAAYASGQGRPPDSGWAASDDSRASYGFLLAQHYGYLESRLAYGGYNWGGGLANVPPLEILLDKITSTVSRWDGPFPDVVLINLGENGIPTGDQITKTLAKLRERIGSTPKIIVMIPVSGKGREQIKTAFDLYKSSANDDQAYLVDLGTIQYATADGGHPTADGHRFIYRAALSKLDAIFGTH